MTLSNITFTTIVLNGTSLAVTSGFGIILYIFVFAVILSSLAKSSAEAAAPTTRTPTDTIFISFGLNDCVALACWLVAGVRATIKELFVTNDLINAAAFATMACRICKRYHLCVLVISRLIALRFYHMQHAWLSKARLITLIILIWLISCAITSPILITSTIEYPVSYFTFHIRNQAIRNFFFIEELVSTAIIMLITISVTPWMITKYLLYRNAANTTVDGVAFVVTETAEVAHFIQETRKSITTVILIGLCFISAVCSWAFARDGDVSDAQRADNQYMIRYFFGVYIWCLNSAIPPTVYIIVEQIIQKVFAKFFENRFNNQVTPGHSSNTETDGHVHVDADRANSVMVFPMHDIGERPLTGEVRMGDGDSSTKV